MEPLWKTFTKQQFHALNTSASSNPKVLFKIEPEKHKCESKLFEVERVNEEEFFNSIYFLHKKSRAIFTRI